MAPGTPTKCKFCPDLVSPDEKRHIRCSVCKVRIHDKCTTVSQESWNQWGPKLKGNWKCSECKIALDIPKPGRKGNKRRRGSLPDGDPELHGADGDVASGAIADIIDEMVSPLIFSIEALKKEVTALRETTLKLMADRLQAIEDENAALRGEVKSLRELNDGFGTRIRELERAFKKVGDVQEESAAYSRRNNVVLRGIPLPREGDPAEDPYDVVAKVGRAAGVPVIKSNIDACHRLPVGRGAAKAAPAIVVKFVNRYLKADFLVKVKGARLTLADAGFTGEGKVFADEHLTAAASELFKKARDLRNVGYRYIWTRNGCVFARKEAPGERTVRIDSQEVIDRLMGMPPPIC